MRLAFCLALITLVGGCGSGKRPLGEITGQVTLQGAPLTAGDVIFESPTEHVSATATIDATGHYRFHSAIEAGLPLGQYQVAIRPQRVPFETGGPIPPPPASDIPAHYHNFATSGLTADVSQPTNLVNFELRPSP